MRWARRKWTMGTWKTMVAIVSAALSRPSQRRGPRRRSQPPLLLLLLLLLLLPLLLPPLVWCASCARRRTSSCGARRSAWRCGACRPSSSCSSSASSTRLTRAASCTTTSPTRCQASTWGRTSLAGPHGRSRRQTSRRGAGWGGAARQSPLRTGVQLPFPSRRRRPRPLHPCATASARCPQGPPRRRWRASRCYSRAPRPSTTCTRS